MNRLKKRLKLTIKAIIVTICLSSIDIHSGCWSSILNTGYCSKNNSFSHIPIPLGNIVETQKTDIQSLHVITSSAESTDENNSSSIAKNHSRDPLLTHNDSEISLQLLSEGTAYTLDKHTDKWFAELDFTQILELSREVHKTYRNPSTELCKFIPNLNSDNYLDLAYFRVFHLKNIPQILMDQNLSLSFLQLNQYFPLILSNLQKLYPQLNEASFTLDTNEFSGCKWFMRIFPKPFTEEYLLVIKVDLVYIDNDLVGANLIHNNTYLIHNQKVETRNPYLDKLLKPLYLVVATELEKERQDQARNKYGVAFSNNTKQVLIREIQSKYQCLKCLVKTKDKEKERINAKLLELVVSTYMFKEELIQNNDYLEGKSGKTELEKSLAEIDNFINLLNIVQV